jgi:hypothetical protein
LRHPQGNQISRLSYNGAIPLDADVRSNYLTFGEKVADVNQRLIRRLITLDFNDKAEVKALQVDGIKSNQIK